MALGEEIAVDIEAGNTLNVRLHALSEAEDDGRVSVFFELNGEPQAILLDDRARSPARGPKRQGNPSKPDHVLALTPGVVTTLPVQVGQRVAVGDMLAALEAMKMEATLSAPRSGTISELLVKLGEALAAKSLLLVIREDVLELAPLQ